MKGGTLSERVVPRPSVGSTVVQPPPSLSERVAPPASTAAAAPGVPAYVPPPQSWEGDDPAADGAPIAVVEDDLDVQLMLAEGLRAFGFDVIACSSAEELLRCPELHELRMAIVDLKLPGMGGTALSERLGAMGISVVILTSSRSRSDLLSALRVGARDYLTKPVDPKEVARRVRELLVEEQAPTVVPRVRLSTGQVIPGTSYRLTRWLGEGGMGTVYLGEHVDLGRTVALKILRSEHFARRAAVDRFRLEARATASIGHPNIVDIFDLTRLDDGRLMIVMEFVDGHDGYDDVANNGPMSPERVISVGRQLCKALHAAHGAGIVHRDVKPDNVILSQQGGRADFVKLVDFGIASIMTRPDDEAERGCTPGYAPPEQILGDAFDGRLDVYALGCTLYHFLTGRTPHDGHPREILRKQLELIPALPSDVIEDVPPALDDVLMRCMAKSPDERYADMQDLEAALCEAQIASGLVTVWDDLPLPEVEEERRRRIEAKMPKRGAGNDATRRWFWPMLALTAVLGAGLVYTLALRPDPAADQVLSPVDRLANEARDAAARANYVYPDPDRPDADTAYTAVKHLEEMGAEGQARAAELRPEFAEGLSRIGDSLWEQPGGRPYARDFYAQALLFVPGSEPALSRSGFTRGMLADLAVAAAKPEFSPGELAAAAPLTQLAKAPDEDRSAMVVELEKEREAKTRSKPPRSNKQPEPEPAPEPEVEIEDSAETGGEEDVVGEEALATSEETPKESKRDPARAKEEAKLGTAALKRGDRTNARLHFNRALSYDYRNLEALDGMGDLNFNAGQYSGALRFRRLATRYSPSSGLRRAKLGDAYFKVLRFRDALREYERAQQSGFDAASRIAKAKSKL